jgi:hypothetical protein
LERVVVALRRDLDIERRDLDIERVDDLALEMFARWHLREVRKAARRARGFVAIHSSRDELVHEFVLTEEEAREDADANPGFVVARVVLVDRPRTRKAKK